MQNSENGKHIPDPSTTAPSYISIKEKTNDDPPFFFLRHDILLSLLLIFLAANYALFKIGVSDFWMHLAQGRYIIDHNGIPTSDVFSYTHYGNEWANWQWIPDVIYAVIWGVAGSTGIILLRMFLFASIVVFFYFLLRRAGQSSFISFLFACVALLILQTRVFDRPFLFSYLFLTILLFLFASRPWPLSGWRIFLTVLLLAVWRNSHPSWLLGGALIFVFYVDQWWLMRRNPPRWMWHTLFPLAGIIAGGFLITPLPLDFSQHFSLQTSGQASLSEWKSVFSLGPELLNGYFLLFFLFSLFVLPISFFEIRRRPFYVIFLLAMLTNAFLHARFIPEAALIGLPLVAEFMESRLKERISDQKVLSFFLFFVLTLFLSEMLRDSLFAKKGFGIDDRMVPLHAAEFMKKESIGGNIYGHYWFSMDFLMGYLYPSVRVAVDSRVPGLYSFEFANSYWHIKDATVFRDMVLPLPLDYILLGHPEWRSDSKEKESDVESLLLQYGYQLVYFDGYSALYRAPEKKMTDDVGLRPLFSFKFLTRWNTDQQKLKKYVEDGFFEDVIRETAVLKEMTTGRDDFYREVLVALYQIPGMDEEKMRRMEKLFGASQ
ncbi:MAG TPA: hypothetical protein PLV42_06000 [bacterium]|nr:hypothetical protein [bacterium]